MLFLVTAFALQSAPVATAPLVRSPAPARSSPILAETPVEPSDGRGSTPARSVAPLPSYITFLDYPDEALRNRQQGSTGVALSIDPDGKVMGCTVIKSSGSRALDATTCRLLQTRPRFLPARGPDGKPVMGVLQTAIRWVLPAAPIGSVEDLVEMSFDLAPDGKISACEVMRRSGDAIDRMSGQPCGRGGPRPEAAAAMLAATGGKGGTVRARGWLLRSPVEPWPTKPTGGTLLGWSQLRLVVGADGAMTSCEVLSAEGPMAMRRCTWAPGTKLANTAGLALPTEVRAVSQIAIESAGR